jgi:hypothetical protein
MVGAATGLAAVAAVAVVVAVSGAAPPATQPRAQSPSLQLMAAAEATARASYRFTGTFCTGDRLERRETGAWDPAGHQGYSNHYDGTGALLNRSRVIGTDIYDSVFVNGVELWSHITASSEDVSADFLLSDESPMVPLPASMKPTCSPAQPYIHSGPPALPKSTDSRSDPGQAMTCTNLGPRPAPGTTDPRKLIAALRDSGSIWDMGVAGTGTAAVHTYGFRVRLTWTHPLSSVKPWVRMETGTIQVGMTTGQITEVSWSIPHSDEGQPDDSSPSTSTWVVKYSGYGLPVQLRRPRTAN